MTQREFYTVQDIVDDDEELDAFAKALADALVADEEPEEDEDETEE